MATKKKIKTYGVRNLMEWVCNIPVGKGHMRIEFTGGVLTSYGNTPAKFVTKDLFQQTVIEHSDFFKKKRIILLSVIESDEVEDKLPQSPESPTPTLPNEGGSKSDEESPTPALPDEGGSKSEDDEGGSKSDEERTEDGRLIVEVESLDDAKTYLTEKFGIAVRNLRSGVSVVTAGTENGVYFKGLERFYEKASSESASSSGQ